MADSSVNIESIAGKPAEAWASEKTALGILKELEKMGKITAQQAKSLGKNGLGPNKKGFDDLDNAINELEKDTKKQTEATKKTTEATNFFGKSLITKGRLLTAALTGTVAAVVGLADSISDQLALNLELTQAGMNLAGSVKGIAPGLATFADAAKTANLTFQELIALQQEYGNVLNIYGVQRFAAVSRDFLGNVKALGVNSGEASEFVAEYLEQQRILGFVNNQTQAQMTKSATEAFKQFDKWSTILGKSREEIQKQINDTVKASVDSTAFIQQGGEGVKKAFDNIGMVFSDPTMQRQLFDAIASPYAANTEFFNALTVTAPGAIDAFEKIRNMARNGITPTEDALAALVDRIAEGNQELALRMGEEGQARNQMIIWGKQLQENIKVSKARTKEEQEALNQQKLQAEGYADFQDTWKSFTQIFSRTLGAMFSNEEFAKSISTMIENITTTMVDMAPVFSETLKQLLSGFGRFVKGLGWVLEKFNNMDITGSVTDFIEKFGGLPGAIAAAIGIAIAGTAGVKIISTYIGRALSGILGKLRMGGKGGAAGAVGGGLGKGIGGLTGGVMGGLAKGFSAFASPAVAAGIAVFSGGIVAIGAALGGAAAILGTGLPLFTNSLKELQNLDGSKLTAVGDGIVALGGGLIAMGTGGIAGAIGGAVSAFADWVGVGQSSQILTLADDVNLLADAMARVESMGSLSFSSGRITMGEKQVVQIQQDEPNPITKTDISELQQTNPTSPGGMAADNEINTLLRQQIDTLKDISMKLSEQVSETKRTRTAVVNQTA